MVFSTCFWKFLGAILEVLFIIIVWRNPWNVKQNNDGFYSDREVKISTNSLRRYLNFISIFEQMTHLSRSFDVSETDWYMLRNMLKFCVFGNVVYRVISTWLGAVRPMSYIDVISITDHWLPISCAAPFLRFYRKPHTVECVIGITSYCWMNATVCLQWWNANFGVAPTHNDWKSLSDSLILS